MKVLQKLNEINYVFKDIALQPNIWEYLLQSLDRLLAPDCLVTVSLTTCQVHADLTRSSMYRFMSNWLNEGLHSLQIEDVRIVAVDAIGDTVQCSVRSYMDRGITQIQYQSRMFIEYNDDHITKMVWEITSVQEFLSRILVESVSPLRLAPSIFSFGFPPHTLEFLEMCASASKVVNQLFRRNSAPENSFQCPV